jgi:crotonobetainyl-CoA:carnitine CoA-transferase CaiB-like acyl-CoA transferase
MSVNGTAGGEPTRLGLPMGDLAGSIFAVFGVLAALNRRHETGRGGLVEVAMLDGLIAMLGYLAQLVFVAGQTPGPVGSKHPSIVPYGAFPTSDGHVIVACLTEGFWRNFATALGRPDLVSDPRFAAYADRLANRTELESIIESEMRQADSAAWLERLEAQDVPHAPILDVPAALEQAHCAARGLIRTVTHAEAGPLRVVASPLRFDGAGGPPCTPPPLLGADSADILTGLLGLTPEGVAGLRARGVIALPG